MIKKEGIIAIVDNSDGQYTLCIHPNAKRNKIKKSSTGNTVKVTIKKRIYARGVIKKKINWVYVCYTGKKITRKSGITLKFKRTAGLILSPSRGNLMATSHKATFLKEMKQTAIEYAPYSKNFA